MQYSHSLPHSVGSYSITNLVADTYYKVMIGGGGGGGEVGSANAGDLNDDNDRPALQAPSRLACLAPSRQEA